MKKIYFLFMFIVLPALAIKAQVVYTSNFDTCTAGVRLAAQLGSPWTTWSNAPGTAEDPMVSSAQSHSSPNSFYVVNNNDCVLQLFDKTTGRYKVEWYMYVESGKLGYFNLLNDFNGSNSIWGFQAYIYHDSIFVDANGSYAASTTFASNSWVKLHIIIDLDDDYATFYKDDTELVSYQWSKGPFGEGSTVKLDAVNFFGWDGSDSPVEGGQSGYYIDDITIESLTVPSTPPMNLSAVLNGSDIDVSWSATTPAADLYKLSCNGAVVSATTALTYTEVGPWPDTYIYAVRAKFGPLGYTHSSNTDTVTIAGGVTRDLVLFEEGTSINCGYCPYAAKGIDSLIMVTHKEAVAIAYHPDSQWGSFADNYSNPSSVSRLIYYQVTGFPSVISDGKWRINGVTTPYGRQYSSVYLPFYNDRIDAVSFHTLNLVVTPTGTDTYTATITAEETFSAFSSVKLHVVLTESDIPVTWGGLTDIDFVCRGMFPDANGTTIDFSSQSTQNFDINFSTAGFVKEKCQLVVFIQDPVTKLVTQTAKYDMSAATGMDEINGNSISLYPNPATDYIIANTSGTGLLEIVDITGKIVLRKNILKTSQTIDIRSLEKGMYIVKVTSEKNTFSEKLIIE
ncbi:MAG TPA: T9SS type A sorting domain-containing protein [Bacteroidales bacterium]|nr:T9SS type A sorting domain-containing protein [Bacteroidales bacterium]